MKSHESTTRMQSPCLQFDGAQSPIEAMVLGGTVGSGGRGDNGVTVGVERNNGSTKSAMAS